MQVNICQVNAERFLEPSDSEAFLAGVRDPGGRFWVDVQDRDPNALAEFLSPLNLHPLVVEACLDPAPKARLAPYESALLIEFPIPSQWDDTTPALLAVLCLPGGIVTIHDQPVSVLETMAREFNDAMRFRTASTTALLYQILDSVIDNGVLIALEGRRTVDAVEEEVDERVSNELAARILKLKRRLARLTTSLEDQHHCFGALQAVVSDCFRMDGLREYFRDALANLGHALRLVARQEARLAAIHQNYLLKLQEKTNNRLRILTILSAVFMPLTLITGIYGMNFRYMPELGWQYSYPIVIGIMVMLACGMVWSFYRRGWFK
jgi:magnesium transporter